METGLLVIQPVRASEIRKSDLELFVGQQITRALLAAGFKLSDQEMKVILDEVPKDIQSRFKLLEMPEIKKAIEDGVRGIYGEYYGISTVTINKWLKSYVDGGNHQAYLASKPIQELKQLAEKAPLTLTEIDDILRSGIVKCFLDYQITGYVIDYGSPKINWLLTKKIIDLPKEKRDEYKQEAFNEIQSELSAKTQSTNRIDRNDAKRKMDELFNTGFENNEIITLAKNMALRDWFEEILESGNDIHELIK